MELTAALGESSFVEHSSGRASVEVYEDMNFSVFTVDKTSFLISDLANGQTSINGTPHDFTQAKAMVTQIVQMHGITLEDGWHPRRQGVSPHLERPVKKGGQPALLSLGLLIGIFCWLWLHFHTQQ